MRVSSVSCRMFGKQKKPEERGDRRKETDSVRFALGMPEIPVSLSSFSNEDGALSDFEKIRRHFMSAFHFRKTFPKAKMHREVRL